MGARLQTMGYFGRLIWGMVLAVSSGGLLWRTAIAAYGVLVTGGVAATNYLPLRAAMTEFGFPELSPWEFGFYAAAVAALFFAARVSFYITPRLCIKGLIRHWDGDDGYHIRAVIENPTFMDAPEKMLACLVRLRPAPIWADQSLSYPLILTTQQRLLRHRTSGKDIPQRRVSIFAKEKNNIELFQIYPNIGMVHISHEGGVEEIGLYDCFLDFEISGFGTPLKFTVRLIPTEQDPWFCLVKDPFQELVIEQMSAAEWV